MARVCSPMPWRYVVKPSWIGVLTYVVYGVSPVIGMSTARAQGAEQVPGPGEAVPSDGVESGAEAGEAAEGSAPQTSGGPAVDGNGAPPVAEVTDAVEPEPEHATLRQGQPVDLPPLDLCTLAPKANSDKYQRQRVLLFNASVDGGADAPEPIVDSKGNQVGQHSYFADVRAGERARLSLWDALPMSRVHSVVVPQEAPSALFDAEALSLNKLNSVLEQDDFATYSATCADWLAIPRVTRRSASWKRVTTKKKVKRGDKWVSVDVPAWDLDTTWNVSLAVYKRTGDEFRRVSVLDAGNAGVGGFAGGAGSTEGDSGRGYHEYVSPWPEQSCSIGKAVDGTPGQVHSCRGLAPHFSRELQITRLSSGGACSPVETSAGASGLRALAECSVLDAVARAGHLVQRDWKRLDGFSLFAPLIATGATRGVAMGRSDSARRGDYYIAKSTDQNGAVVDLGYARIVRLGPGGDAGNQQPSEVKFKSGEAPPGTRMEEYAMLGAHLGASPAALLLVSKGALEGLIAPGAEIDLAYDLSKWIPLSDEFWMRGNLGYYVGSANESFLMGDLGFESVRISGGGSSWVFGAGLSAISASKQVVTASDSNVSLNGGGTGAFVRAAWEHSFSADWAARLGAEARSNFSSSKLHDDSTTMRVDAGTLTGFKLYASFGHTL